MICFFYELVPLVLVAGPWSWDFRVKKIRRQMFGGPWGWRTACSPQSGHKAFLACLSTSRPLRVPQIVLERVLPWMNSISWADVPLKFMESSHFKLFVWKFPFLTFKWQNLFTSVALGKTWGRCIRVCCGPAVHPAVLAEAGGEGGGEELALSTEVSRGTKSQLRPEISEERLFQLRISMIKAYNGKPETFAMG